MNYYNEIKNKIIDNEVYSKVKDYSKERHKVITYFEIGKLLTEAGGKYGDNIIEEYSKKLVVEVGKKYNRSTLFRMRQFYNLFSNEKVAPLVQQLSWSHCLIILPIKNIDEINSYIYSKKANLYLTYKGILFNKKYDVIEMKKYEKCNNDMISIVIDDIGVYNINDHYELEVKKFDKEELKKNKNLLINSNVIWYNSSKLPLVLRNRIDGDRIKINDGTKKIKDLLIDEKIPTDLRDKLLLLEKDNEVLNVFGIRKSQTLIDSKNNDILITLREKE